MPRPNKPRDIEAEEVLAERIQFEREQRGWNYESLARRMTGVGCPINQSAIYKIEQSQPRRRITVNELVAFAKVFETTVDQLILPRWIAEDAAAAKLWVAWQEAERQADEAQRDADESQARADEARKALDDYVDAHPEVRERVLQANAARNGGGAGG